MAAAGGAGGTSVGSALGGRDKLRANIETRTQEHVLKEATRLNRRAARDAAAPTAEVLTEVFETPDEVWPVAKVRTVVMSLRKDYMRALLPYMNLADRTFAADAPSDDDLRARLAASSSMYATLARANQHKHWFEFFTDRTRSNGERDDAYALMELRVGVETGRLTEEEALAEVSRTRAGALQKARALEHMDELRAAGKAPSKAQIRAARAAIAAVKRADEPRRKAGKRSIPPAALAALRAKAAEDEESSGGDDSGEEE